MSRSILPIIALAVAVVVSTDVDARSKWSKHGYKNGISVFTSDHPKSEVPQVKAVALANATPEQVWAYITSPRMHMKGMKDKQVVGSCGDNCDYIYVRLGNVFIDDRHYVVKMVSEKTEIDGHTAYRRSWVQTAARRPLGKGVIVNNINGSWELLPVANGTKTRIIYRNHLDLGGDVPASLYAIGFVSKAYEILEKVKSGV